MSSFCPKCGAPLNDGAKFCPKCGAPITAGPAQNEFAAGNAAGAAGYTAPQGGGKKSNTGKLIGILAAALVAVILVIVILSKLLGGGYKKPVGYIVKGIEKQDYDTFEKGMQPSQVDEFADDAFEIIEDADKISFNYKIIEKDKIKKDDLEDTLADDYYLDEDDIDEITAAYELRVKYDGSIKYDGDTEKFSDKADVLVVKQDGKWYVAYFDLSDFYSTLYDMMY